MDSVKDATFSPVGSVPARLGRGMVFVALAVILGVAITVRGGRPTGPSAGTRPAGAADTGQSAALPSSTLIKAYEYTAVMQIHLALLRAHNIMSPNKDPRDFGAKGDIRVADNMVVTGVPVEFIRAALEAGVGQAIAEPVAMLMVLGIPLPKELDRLLKTLQGGKDVGKSAIYRDPEVRKILVSWWIGGTHFREQVMLQAAGQQPPPNLEEWITADAKWAAAAEPKGRLPSHEWLMGLMLLHSGGEFKRVPISLRSLLERFEPEQAITRDSADAVAEELVWTKVLGLTDGTHKTLPTARRVFQSLLLEQIGFEIGDPTSLDAAKRQEAIRKLDEAKAQLRKTWDAAYESQQERDKQTRREGQISK